VLRPRGLTRERRSTGILPRDGGSLPPVHFDHVAGKYLVVGSIRHYDRLFMPASAIASRGRGDGLFSAPLRPRRA